ncbi:MAG: class I SAM-dependent methyltransferase [Gemmatimonadales bacterium]|nr:class I SAM-dependent methyltransferase [Gemmatimonadales bacterium]
MIEQLLSPSRDAWMVEPGIWSVLPRSAPPQRYDARVKVYDLVVGNRTYNRVLWGSSASKYARFADASVSSRASGWHLDAGCGSLIFSAQAYARHRYRPVVLLDRSVGMLRQARTRLEKLEPARKAPLLLLQADLLDLPFRAGVFDSVLSMGVLHLFSEPERVLGELIRVRAPSGVLFLSSLVLGRSVGDAYLRLLHLCREVARPRSVAQIRALALRSAGRPLRIRRKGSMLFIEAGQR